MVEPHLSNKLLLEVYYQYKTELGDKAASPITHL